MLNLFSKSRTGSVPSKHEAYRVIRASSRAALGLQNLPLLSILGCTENVSADCPSASSTARAEGRRRREALPAVAACGEEKSKRGGHFGSELKINPTWGFRAEEEEEEEISTREKGRCEAPAGELRKEVAAGICSASSPGLITAEDSVDWSLRPLWITFAD